MAKMTNIADFSIRVAISTMPGQPPMETELGPMETGQFPDGYCRPVQGAGVAKIPCILSRANKHLGIPILVPEQEADSARARYQKVKLAHEAKDTNPAATIQRLHAELAVAKAEAARLAGGTKLAAPSPVREELPVMSAQPKTRKRSKANG